MHKSLAPKNRRVKAAAKHGPSIATKSILTSKKPRKAGSTLQTRRLGRVASKSFSTTPKPAVSLEPSQSPQPSGLDLEQRVEQHSDQLKTMMNQFETFQQSQLAFQQQFQQHLQQQQQFQQQQLQQLQQSQHLQFQQQLAVISAKLEEKSGQAVAAAARESNDETDFSELHSSLHLASPASLAEQNIDPATAAKGWYNSKNFRPLFHWAQKAAADNDADGAYYLGLLLVEGRVAATMNTTTTTLAFKQGAPGLPDYHRALPLWTIAADQDHLEAQHRLGLLYYNGNLASPNQVPPADSLASLQSRVNLPSSYIAGEWGPDIPTAIKLLAKAAQHGHSGSQYGLGQLYKQGYNEQGTKSGAPDYKAASKWYTQAATRGHTDAQFALACLFRDKKLGPADPQAATNWYTKAAEQGHRGSQNALGHFYPNRQPADYRASVKWYTMAAEQGDSDAQTNLGYIYDQDFLGSPDHKAAIKWTAMAAEQGERVAQCNLGEFYERGHFGSPDHDSAIKWYTKSANQGYLDAKSSLTRLSRLW